MKSLPIPQKLDIKAFSKTLDDTTAAYKFMWFLSILNILKRQQIENNDSNIIAFKDISRGMVDIATPPLYRFKFNFNQINQPTGERKDPTKGCLDKLFAYSPCDTNDMPVFVNDTLTQSRFDDARKKHLERFAPYLWLRPFYAGATRGMNGVPVHKKIIKLAEDNFDKPSPPPYRFRGEGEMRSIEIHPRWKEYIVSHSSEVYAWAMQGWVGFLHSQNRHLKQNTETILHKLQQANTYPEIDKQRHFWKEIITSNNSKFTCVYSQRPITPNQCDIGHYIPWNYIGSTYLWNLVPVDKEVNRSKSNYLPNKKYLKGLVETQHKALLICQKHFPNKWQDLIIDYSENLQLANAEKANIDELTNAYEKLVSQHIQTAAKSGFTPNWSWHEQEIER